MKRRSIEPELSLALTLALAACLALATGWVPKVWAGGAAPEGMSDASLIGLRVGDTYVIDLEANPTTGYLWQVGQAEPYLGLVERRFQPSTGLMGAGGTEYFTFKALQPGRTIVTFISARPWESAVAAKRSFSFSVAAAAEAALPMTLAEAREIAKDSECGQMAELTDTAFYNDITSTWWIDLDAKKEGCSPACVVNAQTKQAEINWRCTGAGAPR